MSNNTNDPNILEGTGTDLKTKSDKKEDEGFMATLKMFTDKRFLNFVPLIVSRGFSSASLAAIFVSFWTSTMSNLIISHDEKITKAL